VAVVKPNPLLQLMQQHRKPKAGPPSEMTRLQILWDKSLSDEEKDYWREQLQSELPVPEIRRLILDKLKINLQYNNQFTRFREFVKRRDKRDEAVGQMTDDENALLEQHPDWTLDQVRDEVLKRAYARVYNDGDIPLGLDIVRVHINLKRYLLERDKYELEATQRCYDDLPGLQDIRRDSGLSIQEKLRAIRRKLFGEIPEDSKPT
jgi:hypothetical protein